MNAKVVRGNGILRSKEMMDLRLFGWNENILILRIVIMSFLSPLEGTLKESSLVG